MAMVELRHEFEFPINSLYPGKYAWYLNVNMGSDNGFEPSENQPLPEPMWTKILDAL